jgi:NAD+ synthase (glutamine-hydrolysing)
MKIAIAQINTIIGDFDHNIGRMRHFIDRARARGCELIVFPELVVCGYPPRDLLERDDFIDANRIALARLMDETRGIGVICGLVERNPAREGKALFNAAVLFEDGRVLHTAQKRLLPTYDVFDESRFFEPGAACEVFTYRGARIGLTICEDAWNDPDITPRRLYHVDPVQALVAKGAELLINVSASPFHMGKRAFRLSMFCSLAAKYRVPLVFANQVGGNDGVLFEGFSAVFDKDGAVVCRATDFKEDLIVWDSERPEDSDPLHPVAEDDMDTLLGALVMGTRDYVTKCGFSKAVIGLSGGIDSALTAWIAAEALGAEQVATVFMPSRYTSQDNYDDTRQLAENLGVGYRVIPIDDMFAGMLGHISPEFGKGRPAVTEQNIQARLRGTLLMAISNKTGALVLSTGNKSELAVGYCTLYGDMNGGLAVISDVPKTLVYALSRRINRDRDIIPRRILEKAPSAELAPDQTDQDDLPPYDVLDAILKGYVEEFKSVKELIGMGFDVETVRGVIRRVDLNEYKRHQAAPGLKVTSKAFGEGRRYPIAKRFVPGA